MTDSITRAWRAHFGWISPYFICVEEENCSLSWETKCYFDSFSKVFVHEAASSDRTRGNDPRIWIFGTFFHGNGCQALAQAALGSGGVLIPGIVEKPHNVALGNMIDSECGAALKILKACSNLNDSTIFWVFHHTAVKENNFFLGILACPWALGALALLNFSDTPLFPGVRAVSLCSLAVIPHSCNASTSII